jgi:hypothetical protein
LVAAAIALASSSALAVASPAFAGTLNYNSATRTMTYTGGPGPDVPRWGDQDAQGNIQISVSDEDPMVPTGDSQLCLVTSPAVFIICPADQVVADLGGGMIARVVAPPTTSSAAATGTTCWWVVAARIGSTVAWATMTYLPRARRRVLTAQATAPTTWSAAQAPTWSGIDRLPAPSESASMT